MERKKIINKIKEILKLRHYQPNEYDKEDAEKVYNNYINQVAEKWTYDWNVYKQETLYIVKYSWAWDIEEAIRMAKEACERYIDEWYEDVKWTMKYNQLEVIGRRLIPFNEFFDKRISSIRFQKIHTPEYNIADMLHKELKINPSQIRYIYIKLLLEEKITLEDFKQLCSSTNWSIDLQSFVKENE